MSGKGERLAIGVREAKALRDPHRILLDENRKGGEAERSVRLEAKDGLDPGNGLETRKPRHPTEQFREETVIVKRADSGTARGATRTRFSSPETRSAESCRRPSRNVTEARRPSASIGPLP